MNQVNLTQRQREVIEAGADSRIFLSGQAGCGKTTVGLERMLYLLEQGIPANSLLVLSPQRTLAAPYFDASTSPRAGPGGQVSILTVGGLAQRTVDLFWPLAAETAGFTHPDQPPVFLTLETAQYYMAHLVRPLLEEGFFESITIDRNRLYSQIIDNLNKSAVIGFPHTEIGDRLNSAWLGDPGQRRIYQDAQESASRFRAYCLEHNLLDFSLQLEVFLDILWPDPVVREYLTQIYQYLIYDNVEEDIPRAHDLLRDWLPEFKAALLIYDTGGGYRKFLGADPETGQALSQLCDQQIELDDSFAASQGIANLANNLRSVISPSGGSLYREKVPVGVLSFPHETRFYPQMLDWVAEQTRSLVSEAQIPPGEIVILAPYLSDSLRFSIMERLQARGIPVRSHRPSRSLRDEPASQALLTLAALAHPGWHMRPNTYDVTQALLLALDGMDLVRAKLLTEIVYRSRELTLAPFEQINPDMQERITFLHGNHYTQLRSWILEFQAGPPLPLDHFLRKMFGEVLSQPGFGFHHDFDAVRVAASLIESIRKFRLAMEPAQPSQGGLEFDLGSEYISMLQDGVISAQYLEAWRTGTDEAVLVAPAYTFLMMNRPVTAQFWLDPGSSGWVERLSQPLTQPYVLSRGWPDAQLWTDAHEVETNQENLARLASGLLYRCRERLFLGLADLGESGFEQRGALLQAFQQVLQESSK
ncbi:MAG: ATP-dependent helicase [Anaerolineales bacterium]|nr:ATP-dependent helicase [Anaerolineales bacterium]